ncbi:MAG: AsnC family transcriptional regulator [Planctomycetes bacterium GWF2_50_10]|nr:MAG: AsnC family transcriptional regulator [Planctomycetes bacterium GWF2_50_10]
MKLSTRSRYGVRALLELAIDYDKGPLQIKTIAEREKISNKYLEQLIAILKASGLVTSVRGPKGGYMLSRQPKDIHLSEVFKVLEGPITVFDCLVDKDACTRCGDCLTKKIWVNMQDAINKVLDSVTLQDMANDAGKHKESTKN